ncbi:MAG TPA: 1-cyclohexenylcarbonyl CoA reductase [Planctomycetaceae bacterium]|jgi:enoyl-[acyl-carrier protein] reductase III|nr:1-cyclohexenylcarbonyl CoA reductase [Planctomycetaceae bacterium]|tara:strand:+ start:1306 stop:2070 length:765 start_codon:yes stop_codon:yes gene_type:complete
MIDLSGKVALVTGSSRGIGRACALRLAEAGADVVVNYVTSSNEAELVAEQIAAMGRNVACVRADVSHEDDVEEMLQFVSEKFGRLDILVHNAATGGFRPLSVTTQRHFDAAMHTNVMSLVHLLKAASPMLQQGSSRGKAVVLSSHGTHMALPMYGIIGGSKAALTALARHWALELGDTGVNVNVVEAGLVETDSTKRLPGADQMFAGRESKTMTGERMLEASDVADAVLFLSSPLSDLVQGQTLIVDGGAAIHV